MTVRYIVLVSFAGAGELREREQAIVQAAAGRRITMRFADRCCDEDTFCFDTSDRAEAERLCEVLDKIELAGLICNQLSVYKPCPRVLTKT
jgi:hypothetical protein